MIQKREEFEKLHDMLEKDFNNKKDPDNHRQIIQNIEIRKSEVDIVSKSVEQKELVQVIQYLMTKIHSLTDIVHDNTKEIKELKDLLNQKILN